MRTCAFLVALSCFVACKSKSSSEPAVSSSASAAPSAEAPAVARPATAVVATRADVKSFVADAGNVYWLSGGYTGAPKGLLVAPKAGGTPKKLAEVNQQHGLWVTGANVYFMDGPEIFLIGKTGGTPASFAKGEMLGPAAAGGDTFCWMAGSAPKLEDASPAGGAPQKTSTAAGEMTLLCKKDSGKMVARVQKMPMILPGPLLVSGDEVFWTSRRDQTVLASATDGGGQRTVASEMARVEALAANASTLFLIGVRGSEKGVYAVDRKGGTPKLLAPIDAPVAMDLAADSTNVYYAVKGGLFSVPVAGGTPTALFQDAYQEPQGLAVDGSNVFLAIGIYVHRLPKPEPR